MPAERFFTNLNFIWGILFVNLFDFDSYQIFLGELPKLSVISNNKPFLRKLKKIQKYLTLTTFCKHSLFFNTLNIENFP